MWLSNAPGVRGVRSMLTCLLGPGLLMKPPQVLILEQRPALGTWANAALLPSDGRILTKERHFPHLTKVSHM